MPILTVLHTADLHNRLTAAATERLQSLREQQGAVLLDSGDALAVPNVLVPLFTPAVLRRMNQAGYSAMALGNREYFFRRRALVREMSTAQFPVLAANLRAQQGDLGPIKPTVILSSPQGDKLGVFGLTPTMIEPGACWEMFSDMRFVSWEQAAREAVEALRPHVQWLVALSHLTWEESLRLAETCPDIDLVLAGHSHPATPQMAEVGPVTACATPPYGQMALLLRSQRGARATRFDVETIALQ